MHSRPGNRIDLNTKKYTMEREKHGKKSRKRGTFFGTYKQKTDALKREQKHVIKPVVEEETYVEEDKYESDHFESDDEIAEIVAARIKAWCYKRSHPGCKSTE